MREEVKYFGDIQMNQLAMGTHITAVLIVK